MTRILGLSIVILTATPGIAGEKPAPLITGLKNPQAVATGTDGRVYVTLAGDKDNAGALYRSLPNGNVSVVGQVSNLPDAPAGWKPAPRGVVMDGASFVLMAESSTGTVYRVNVANGKGEKVADGFGAADGLTW